MKRNLKKDFLLDPDIHFFNHGSFGACPHLVFEVYQSFQRELEKKPVEFLGRQIIKRMEETRSKLAEYIKCQANEVVYTLTQQQQLTWSPEISSWTMVTKS
jgi:isopenicillin-N epimerase